MTRDLLLIENTPNHHDLWQPEAKTYLSDYTPADCKCLLIKMFNLGRSLNQRKPLLQVAKANQSIFDYFKQKTATDVQAAKDSSVKVNEVEPSKSVNARELKKEV